MPLEQLLLLIGFVIAMTGTPGPNNVILMTTGANCGFWRSVPHLCGIAVGSQLLLFAIAFGMEEVLLRWPESMTILRVSGSLFLVFMAVQMVMPAKSSGAPAQDSPAADSTPASGKPLTFWQAVLFQWINPKSWLMCITAVATFADPAQRGSMLVVALALLIFGSVFTGIWSAAGMLLKSWLRQGQRLLRFNQAMAVMLLVSIYPLVM